MPNQQLGAAIANAELAVDYAAKNAIEIPPALMLTVASTRATFETGSVSQNDEVAFYTAYFALSKAIHPATIGGIRDSTDLLGSETRIIPWFGKRRRISAASRAIRNFRYGTAVALTLLLIFQAYWLIGYKTLRVIQEQSVIIKEKPGTDESKQAQLIHEAQFFLLNMWLSVVPGRSRLERTLSSKDEADMAYRFSLDPKAEEFPEQRNRIRLAVSEHVLSILQIYLLPLLYGLLGAFAYVLRQLTIETRSRVFRVDSVPTYWLRVFLGMLAGLCVGWFLKPGHDDNAIGNLTPFAISFLAGYSVDVLFSIMDKLVNTFGSFAKDSKG